MAEAVLFRLDRDPMASTVVVVVVNAFAVVVQTPEGFQDDQSLD